MKSEAKAPTIVSTMHIRRVASHDIARAVASMAIDRIALSRTSGLRFWKLLGTGSGQTFTPQDADPSTWGLFAVWDSADAAQRFAASSAVPARWAAHSAEQWYGLLLPVAWKGRWSRRDPFDGAVPGVAVPGRAVAALTRARVKPSQWRAFARATPPVAAAVNGSPGLRYTVGIGEAPIGLQGTFSLWESNEAVRNFAYANAEHRAVMARTHTERWYAEELFARFAVLESSGTIAGRSL